MSKQLITLNNWTITKISKDKVNIKRNKLKFNTSISPIKTIFIFITTDYNNSKGRINYLSITIKITITMTDTITITMTDSITITMMMKCKYDDFV